MLKVHFVAGTRAGRVVWLLEELGLEYEVNIMPFTKEGLKSPEHRSRHALGRVPVLEDGDITIFESQGLALWDLVTAINVCEIANTKGIGEKINV